MDAHDRLAYLTDPAVWAEPTGDLEERIVAAIAAERAPSRSRRLRYVLLSAVAAAIVGGGTAAVVLVSGQPHHSERFVAALSGTALAPHASGQVTLTQTQSGWRVQLHATGLVRLDRGRFYEAWLRSASGMLVPIGTFNQPEDVTLWSGVAPTGYPRISVTRQVAGAEASSGQVVLIGSARRS